MNSALHQKITFWSVLQFTIPSMVMMVVMSLYTVVDGTFVARFVGTDAFSAVNIVYPLESVAVGMGMMFGTGTTALVSRKLGQSRREEANQNLTFIIIFTIILGICISVFSLSFLTPILYRLGANAEIFSYCYDYAKILIFFFTANILQIQFQNLYVANGKPHIGLITTVSGGLINVVLDYLFIAKFGMGISGAALATGLGASVPAAFGIIYFTFQRKGNLCFTRPKADWHALCQAALNGSSEMVNFLSTSITTFLFNIIMMRLVGQNGVAAIAILLYLDFVLVAVNLGYSMGVAPLISYNFGCNEIQKLRKLFRISLTFCFAFGVIMTFGTVFFADRLASIFTLRGTEVYVLAVTGLKIYALGYLFKGYNIFASSMFTAFGNGPVSAILSFMRTLVLLSVCLLGLSWIFGVMGVWYASPLAEMSALSISIVFTVKYRKKYRYFAAIESAG